MNMMTTLNLRAMVSMKMANQRQPVMQWRKHLKNDTLMCFEQLKI
jgi:hypothetical protein